MKGIVKTLTQGAQDAVAVVGGKAASRLIKQFVPFGENTGMMGMLKEAVGAVAVSMLAQQFVGKDVARFATAGALAGVVEGFAKTLPVIGPALGDDGGFLLPPIGEYPGDPQYVNIGEYPEMYAGDLMYQ